MSLIDVEIETTRNDTFSDCNLRLVTNRISNVGITQQKKEKKEKITIVDVKKKNVKRRRQDVKEEETVPPSVCFVSLIFYPLLPLAPNINFPS